MRNYKVEKKLFGSKNWKRIAMVFVNGIPSAPPLLPNATEEENEEIIQSWNNILVMKATSDRPAEFYLGFYNKNVIEYLKHKFETNLYFGMRIGPEDVNFFVFFKDLVSIIELEVIEQTTIDNSKYSNLLLI